MSPDMSLNPCSALELGANARNLGIKRPHLSIQGRLPHCNCDRVLQDTGTYTKQHSILRTIDTEEEAGTSMYRRTDLYAKHLPRYTNLICNL
jgi:hypothetical protein